MNQIEKYAQLAGENHVLAGQIAEIERSEAGEAVRNAQSKLADCAKLQLTLDSMPNGKAIWESLMNSARKAVSDAENAMPIEYVEMKAVYQKSTMALRDCLESTIEAMLIPENREFAVEFLRSAIQKSFRPTISKVAVSGNGNSSSNPKLPNAIMVHGTRFEPAMTPKNRQSWPGLKQKMIDSGVPEAAWYEHGKTTSVRVANRFPAICTLIY